MADNKFKLNKTIMNTFEDGTNVLEAVKSTTGTFFTGVDDEVNKILDPIVTGYAFIYWVSLPKWFEEDPDLQYFKSMTQKNFRSFNGVNALELGTAQQNSGFAGNEINVVTGITRSNTEFTIGHKEFSGSPMTKMYNKWVSLIRDPRTGIATYPKIFNCEYGARNHSGQLLYIVTRPDVNNVGKNNIEYAAFYSNVVPTNVPLDSLYNFEIGSQDSPTIEINFKGFPEIGPAVTEYARKILSEKIISSSGDGYIPFVDALGGSFDTTKSLSWGTEENPLMQIYGENKK